MINIAGTVNDSITDGDGLRYTIFVQGCKHKCFKCQNPETWSFEKINNVETDKLFKEITSNPILDGITFSGGDPMYQAHECMELAKRIKSETDLNIWCYTGFTYEELIKMDDCKQFLEYIDILVDGPYIDNLRSLSLKFRGSSNQRVIDVQESLKKGKIILLY